MIAIAESGSTKTQWFIIDLQGNIQSKFKTRGFNPDLLSSEIIKEILNESEDLIKIGSVISKVYFFGASCSSANNISKMSNCLKSLFQFANIFVDHDLKACAYALSKGNAVISCIIGTGSNSALFDGNQLIEEVHALGYILGDECSGSYFGKKLLRAYYYHQLPSNIANDFQSTYELDWSIVREYIYGNRDANVYLASFMPFIIKHKKEPFMHDLISEGVRLFINVHVKCFEQYECREVGFVGTIASLISDILEAELKEAKYQLGKIIRSPGEDLVNYLIKHKNILE